MDRKEKVFEFIKSENNIPLKAEEMAVLLDVPKSDFAEFTSILTELTREGKIYQTKKCKYLATENDPQITSGVLSCNFSRGFGFVRCEDDAEGDIFVAMESMNGAFDRDRVLVRVDKCADKNSRREGHVMQILQRGNSQLIGVIKGIKSGRYIFIPDRREFFSEVLIPAPMAMNAKKNDRVLIKIDRYTEKNQPYGSVITVLGTSDSLVSCLEGVLLENNYHKTFPKDVIDEAEKIPSIVTTDEIKDREDLRSTVTFTIDGEDSRDFDDAVSLEQLPNGNTLLGVHIADVTHYVKEGTALDAEAQNRATSVYFPHTVIPMLPEKLSNGICSLNPDVDRLTLIILMEFDSDSILQ